MLNTKLCNIPLTSPTILASGILGVSKDLAKRMSYEGVGAITLKSLCHEERSGNPNPTMFASGNSFFNAVGLPGQGIDNAISEFQSLDDINVPIILSIFGYREKDFAYVAKRSSILNPAMIEVDISCPHMDYVSEYYDNPKLASKITKSVVKNSNCPVSIKLSPDTANIVKVAEAVERSGASCITAINTAKAMIIDIDVRKPILSNQTGGLSGPSLKPIAVRCVYDIFKKVKIPIIGTGGVSNGKDAVEMIMAGASAVGIGTAVYYNGMSVFKKINEEIIEWMKKNKIKDLSEIRGCAHDK